MSAVAKRSSPRRSSPRRSARSDSLTSGSASADSTIAAARVSLAVARSRSAAGRSAAPRTSSARSFASAASGARRCRSSTSMMRHRACRERATLIPRKAVAPAPPRRLLAEGIAWPSWRSPWTELQETVARGTGPAIVSQGAMAGPFERFIGIDWSGAASRSGQRIYVAEAHRQGARITLHSVVRARDRAAVEDYLGGGPLEHAPTWEEWAGPGPIDRRARRVVAMDFAFGFPAAFEHPHADGGWGWADLASWAAALAGNGEPSAEPVRRAI